MDVLEWVLRILVILGNGWMTILLGYHLYLSLFGFKKTGRSYEARDPQARFLILVPAHNEEAVIADMVRSLEALDYPKELYDAYIIADNCADQTARIARSLGAEVLETYKESEDAPTGKPLALKAALERLSGYEKRYDLLMIFDADNLMDASILREVNSQFISEDRPEIIQCYLGTKNREGLVALFYHVTYTITNRFMNLAKYRLGVNVSVGGTGFAIRTDYLAARGGWRTSSLTEDFETQVDVALSGGRILWNHAVRIYDEKPTDLPASFRQRLRWSQGHWYVAFRNTSRLFRVWRSGGIGFHEMLSLLTYMYSMASPVVLMVVLLTAGLRLLGVPGVFGNALATGEAAVRATAFAGLSLPGLLLSFLPTVLFIAYGFMTLFYYAERVDNGVRFSLRRLPTLLFCDLVNLLNVSLAQILGLFRFRRQDKWVKTRHKIRARKEQEISLCGADSELPLHERIPQETLSPAEGRAGDGL